MVKLWKEKRKPISSTKVSQKSNPVVFTGNKPIRSFQSLGLGKDLDEWAKKLKIQILYSHVRANKKELRKKYSNFD